MLRVHLSSSRGCEETRRTGFWGIFLAHLLPLGRGWPLAAHVAHWRMGVVHIVVMAMELMKDGGRHRSERDPAPPLGLPALTVRLAGLTTLASTTLPVFRASSYHIAHSINIPSARSETLFHHSILLSTVLINPKEDRARSLFSRVHH
jgi:hypothetical protein